MNLREEEDLLDWLENNGGFMTCTDFRAMRQSRHPFSMSRAERTAMVQHFFSCDECRSQTEAMARRSKRQLTAEERATAALVSLGDALDPECGLDELIK